MYLLESILTCIENPKLIQNLEKDIYTIVANNHTNSTYLNIKWAIDKTITSMYRYTNLDLISKYFNIEKKKKPTSKLLIQTIASKYMNV